MTLLVRSLALALLFAPILAGLIGTVLPAFDYLPALGRTELSLTPWHALFAMPGIVSSVLLSLGIGLSASLLSLLLACCFLAWLHASSLGQRIALLMEPLLSTPHSALALGLAFLLLPSGWIARLLSPWLTGWTQSPDLLIVGHPSGWPVILALIIKETPYLLLLLMAVLRHGKAHDYQRAAQSLGYSPASAWFRVVLPVIYRQIRLPMLAVLAFSVSVVDVAIILGPSSPAPLGVELVRLYQDADILKGFPAASGAILQLLMVIACIGLWLAGEQIIARIARPWLSSGPARTSDPLATRVGQFLRLAPQLLTTILLILSTGSLLALLLWSMAGSWRFPSAIPDTINMTTWINFSNEALALTGTSLAIAVASTAIALCFSLLILETKALPATVMYLPLLLPQLSFMFGIQVILVKFAFDGQLAIVSWVHCLFVLPYMHLALEKPWQHLDPRYAQLASSLGLSQWQVFFKVKLPLLIKPILTACAVGIAVSIGLYLPTLFAGAGRIATLTTEAVTLASNGDRRVVSVLALVQAMIPLFAFVVAIRLPKLLFRQRKGML